jgi:hypothetical protein
MPDIACEYTLTTPAGTIVFNDGSADQFYITNIPTGLAGAPIRAPIDNLSYANASKGYNFWLAGRHITIEGNFFVTSVDPCPAAVAIWNQMEEDLRVALESIAAHMAAVATLVWRPAGQTQKTLIVRNDVPLETQPDQDYLARTFNFGLFAEDPTWTETP